MCLVGLNPFLIVLRGPTQLLLPCTTARLSDVRKVVPGETEPGTDLPVAVELKAFFLPLWRRALS